jgi:hypothetical protein
MPFSRITHLGAKCDTQHKRKCSIFFIFMLFAECRYAECRYAECRYAECHGSLPWAYPYTGEQIQHPAMFPPC